MYRKISVCVNGKFYGSTRKYPDKAVLRSFIKADHFFNISNDTDCYASECIYDYDTVKMIYEGEGK